MYTILLEAHSGWRYVVLLVLGIALVRMVIGWIRGTEWGTWENRIGLAVPIVLDIQLLLGIVLWISGFDWLRTDRARAWEHPIMMLAVVAAAHVTWILAKKRTEPSDKFRIATIGYGLTAVLVALGISLVGSIF